MKLIYLSASFYAKYRGCTEIMNKSGRPYLCLTLKIDNRLFAIPIRHHINHPFAFTTVNGAGLDYTKAVIIESDNDIGDGQPWIDSREWQIIKQSEAEIVFGFKKYLRQYKRALKHPDNPRSEIFLRYSALQYFEL